jgi:ketosteroid isomerase-like protein
MKITTFVTALILTASNAALAAPAKESNEDAVKTRVAEFTTAFNKADAKVLAAMFTDDATLINPAGKTAKGPARRATSA